METMADYFRQAGMGEPAILGAAEGLAPRGLLPVQRTAFRAALLGGADLAIISPTGSGKSLVGAAAALRAVHRRRMAMILVPTRALAREWAGWLEQALGPHGLRVAATSGDDRSADGAIEMGRVDVVVAVYEKARALYLKAPGLRGLVGCLVADEAQIVEDSERGPSAELLLHTWRRAAEPPQLILLSSSRWVAGLGKSLGCRVIEHTTRPEPLIEGVVDLESGRWRERADDGQATEHAEFTALRETDSLAEQVSALFDRLELPAIIFAQSRRQADMLARELAERRECSPDPLVPPDSSAGAAQCADLVCRRVACHHAALSGAVRRAVEEWFRAGRIDVLVATTTLAEGVNLHAKTVMILGNIGGNRCATSLESSIAGRVARPGTGPGRALRLVHGKTMFESAWQRLLHSSSNRLVLEAPRQQQLEALACLLEANAGLAASQVEVLYNCAPGLSDTFASAFDRGVRYGLWRVNGEAAMLTDSGRLLCQGFPIDSLIGCRTLLRRFPDGGGGAAMYFLVLGGSDLCDGVPISRDEHQCGRWVGELCEHLAGDRSALAAYFHDFLWRSTCLPRRHHQGAKAVLMLLALDAGHALERVEQDFAVPAGLVEDYTARWRRLVALARGLDSVLPESSFVMPPPPRPATGEPEPVPAAPPEPGDAAPPELRLLAPGTGVIRFGGQCVRLTRLQYRLLEILALHPEEGVAYERIERHVWPDAVVERQQVGFHRRRLEERLLEAAPWPGPLFETMASWGLRILLPAECIRLDAPAPREPSLLRRAKRAFNFVAWPPPVRV